MKVIAIYHHPQECGDPYIALISQDTGQVVETITIPDGYYDSGSERVDTYIPVYTFIEKVHQAPKPTVDNVTLTCGFYPNPKHYTFRVTEVDNILEDDQPPFTTWKADVHVEACTHEISWNYDPAKDSFLQQLTEAGFDMSQWELPSRQKTSILDFLKDILSSYKDYQVLNLIPIG